MGPVGGSGGWLGEKNSTIIFVTNELKCPPKNNMSFLFLSTFGVWVGGTEANVDKSTFFYYF